MKNIRDTYVLQYLHSWLNIATLSLEQQLKETVKIEIHEKTLCNKLTVTISI